MAFTHQINVQWSRSNETFSLAVVKEAGGEINLEESIPAASTDLQLTLAIDVSAMKSLVLVCDRDLTLKTNSTSVPDDTIALKAGEPVVWWTNCPYANLLTVDVTVIFVTLAAGAAATLKVRGLQDVTP